MKAKIGHLYSEHFTAFSWKTLVPTILPMLVFGKIAQHLKQRKHLICQERLLKIKPISEK